jgi:hypothetical protein
MRFIRLSPHLCAAAGRRDLRENEMHPTSNEHQGLSVTRRRFLRSGALTAAIVPTLSVWNLPAAAADATTGSSFAPNADLLRSAKSTAEWIRSVQKQDERGVWWLPEPDHPEKLTTVSAANAIYSGSASGVGAALLHVHLAEQGRYSAIVLPDNPFPATRKSSSFPRSADGVTHSKSHTCLPAELYR